MAGVEEKKQRTIASRKFTRCYNRLNEAIVNKNEIDFITNKFSELKSSWNDIQVKHDNYLIAKYPDADESEVDEAENRWLANIEERFEIVQKAKCDYIKVLDDESKLSSEIKAKENLQEQSKEALRAAQFQRDSLFLMFKQELEHIDANLKRDANVILQNQIIADMKDAKSHLEKCKEAHLVYISYNKDATLEEENKWIEDIQNMYEKYNDKLFTYLKQTSEIEYKEKRKMFTKLENIKMPSFSGNIREYAKYKADFKSQVECRVESPETLAYVLRSSLKGEALYLVESIEDVASIWKRLDERFGNPSLLIDAIMNEIRSIGHVKEGNSKEFIRVVNIIEKGYLDLKRLKLEKEMSNTVTVSLLESRLPVDIKREWSKEINRRDSSVDPYNKFPAFMEFLKEQRIILEYENAHLRISESQHQENQGIVNYGTRDPPFRNERINSRCNLHKSNNHLKEECREYLNKTPLERLEIIKELKACWSCLKIGHRLSDCRNKRTCGISGCSMAHHSSLHEPLSVTRNPTVANNREI